MTTHSRITAADRSQDCFLRLPDVKRRTGLSRTTIYRKMGRGEFPAAQQLGANSVAWYESDIVAWMMAPMEWQAAA